MRDGTETWSKIELIQMIQIWIWITQIMSVKDA